jgi:hypothetical protein
MKKFILFIMMIAAFVRINFINAQTLQDIPCTGYTGDVVADGNNTSMASTTSNCDGSGYVFVDGTFNPGSGVCATTGIWPANLKMSSNITSGLIYELQPPSGNNDLVLIDASTGTLTLNSPVMATNLYVLHCSGGAAGTVSVLVTFTDMSTQQFTGIATSNWCTSTSAATAVFNRTVRSTSTTCSVSTCQYMFQMSLAIDAANQSKYIQSLTFTNSAGCILNVFAVGGNVITGSTTPVIPDQTTTVCTGSSFNVAPVNNPPGTIVPVGTTYTWPAPVVTGGMTGGAASSGSQASISGTLVNPTLTPQTATYTVTPQAGSNIGAPFTVTVTVGPMQVLTTLATPATICNGASSILSASSNINGTVITWYPGLLSGSPVSVTPATTITYTVSGSYSGCTATATVTVTVNPNPVLTPAATPAAICNGSSSTLDVHSNVLGTQFAWSPGALTGSPLTVTPAVTTVYSVAGVTPAGCTGTANVTVVVNPVPPTPVITLNGNTISSNTSSGNQWYDLHDGLISGAVSQTFQPQDTGYYFVIVTLNGCSSDTSNIIHYTNVGIGEIPVILKGVTITPNPCKEITMVSYSLNAADRVSIYLTDLTGRYIRRICDEDQTKGDHRISISALDLDQGLYFCQISISNNIFVEKIVVLK